MRSTLGLSFLLFLVAGCGPQTYYVVGESRAAGVDADIEVSEISGGNHMLEIELRHLLPPDRVEAGLTTYCLWFIPQNEPARLASIIEYDPDDRTGHARATTPAHRFEVRVTAERGRDVVSPSEYVIIKQRIEHTD